jgi:hypothetical protein
LFCPEAGTTNRNLQSSPLQRDNRRTPSFRTACNYMRLGDERIFADD